MYMIIYIHYIYILRIYGVIVGYIQVNKYHKTKNRIGNMMINHQLGNHDGQFVGDIMRTCFMERVRNQPFYGILWDIIGYNHPRI